MMQYSLEKRMLRPESMPEIKRLQELRRLMLSGEALRSGGKVTTYRQMLLGRRCGVTTSFTTSLYD